MPFTLSHRLNPILREYRRASATCIDASLKPLMARYLRGLAERLRRGRLRRTPDDRHQPGRRDRGGDGRRGADPRAQLRSRAWRRSSAGIYARRDAASGDAIVADTGGTSFDVSLVRDGRIPWTSETWLGQRFTGHMTGFPSVDVKSIGAGGGSIVRLDAAGLLHVGPESAGADPGRPAMAAAAAGRR